MQFKMEVDDAHGYPNLLALLGQVTNQVALGYELGRLTDADGNEVGEWRITE